MRKITLSPSVMCMDLANLEKSIKELESIGIDALHIDIIDGAFSPSMPLGIDTVKRIRSITTLPFDVHIMSLNNEYFINEILVIGVQHITFHYETSLHVDRYINLIKEKGVSVGVALNPATSLSALDYILPQVDLIMLMLINPGFATNKNEKQVFYAEQKVRDLRKLIDSKNYTTKIQVDGRVSLDTIPMLVNAGANNLVLGSTSLFMKDKSLLENKQSLDLAIKKGLQYETTF